MALSTVIGQETATTALRTFIARDTVPQSLLFVGADGVGKTTTAIEFAKALVCKNRTANSDACDACANCRRIDVGEHPDIKRVAPDGEQTKIWQLWSRSGHAPGVLESLPYSPVAAPRRVILFERAETFNEESANSLLKALEEPPPYVNFILCAPAPSAVLPTILSRCQMIRFRQASTEAIAQALVVQKEISPEEARVLAAYSEGAPGKAFRLADAPEIRSQREALLDVAYRIALCPPIGAFRLAEDLRNAAKPAKAKKSDVEEEGGDKGVRGDVGRAIDVLCAWYADLLAVVLRGVDAPLIHADRRAAVIDAVKRHPKPEQVAENLETLFTFRRHIARNANTQLATEVLMAKLVPRS
jgi:DNA polymerase-3 subunit delta'